MAEQMGGTDPQPEMDDVVSVEGAEHNADEGAAPSADTDTAQAPVQGGEGEPVIGADLAQIESLKHQLASANEQLDELKDKALRAEADLQNGRRRAERDVENAHRFALEKFVNDLLPIVDGLERGLEAIAEDDETQKVSREGMVLTLKMFLDVLTKYQVQKVDPIGEPFDPQQHQAMSMQENNDAEPNSVLAVVQKGYSLNGRLVRPAMVVVSKAAPTVDTKV